MAQIVVKGLSWLWKEEGSTMPTTPTQVWPQTQFFSVSFFVKKLLICLEGKFLPLIGKYFSLLFLPAIPSWTLEGLF